MVGELNSEREKERKNPKGNRLFLYYSKITEKLLVILFMLIERWQGKQRHFENKKGTTVKETRGCVWMRNSEEEKRELCML